MYLRQNPDLPADIAENIRAGRVIPGMSEEQVRATWGEPSSVDFKESAKIWQYYEKEPAGGVKATKVAFKNGKVAEVETELKEIESPHERTWDKYTPQDVRMVK
jgi:hypothetical protein